jgi:hypothetical protein
MPDSIKSRDSMFGAKLLNYFACISKLNIVIFSGCGLAGVGYLEKIGLPSRVAEMCNSHLIPTQQNAHGRSLAVY